MRIQITYDGKTLDGTTAADVVDAMNRTSWRPDLNRYAHMRQVAARVKIAYGATVNAGNPHHFLLGLHQLGLIQIQPNQGELFDA